MREFPSTPEGRAPREPLELLRERERARRLTASFGLISVAAVFLPSFLKEIKRLQEIEDKLNLERGNSTISRTYFRWQRKAVTRVEVRSILASLLIVMLSEVGRRYVYRLLVQAAVQADKRHARVKAVRKLFYLFAEYGISIENVNLQDVDLSEMYLHDANLAKTNLSRSNLSSTYLRRADFSQSELKDATLQNTDFRNAALINVYAHRVMAGGASFANADLSGASLAAADLHGANLDGATIEDADLRSVNFRRASLVGARLIRCDLSKADFTGADLRHADFVECDVSGSIFREAYVYGTAAWGLIGVPKTSTNLVITPEGEPEVVVDDLEVAQLLYLFLYDSKIRRVIDAVTSSVVLILGRFTQERLEVLELIRSELRDRGYSPVLFNFEKPVNRDLTETISALAHLARFVIADITDARGIPQELERIVPNLPSVPIQPILKAGVAEYAMFEHFKRYPWVLPVSEYPDSSGLIQSLGAAVIDPAESFLGISTNMPKAGKEPDDSG